MTIFVLLYSDYPYCHYHSISPAGLETIFTVTIAEIVLLA